MNNDTLPAKVEGNKVITNDEKTRKIIVIEREIQHIFEELKHIEREEAGLSSKKAEYIRAVAEDFERLHGLGRYTEPINTICAHITRLAREHQLFASPSWIRAVLDSRYKQEDYIHSGTATEPFGSADTGLDPNAPAYDVQVIHWETDSWAPESAGSGDGEEEGEEGTISAVQTAEFIVPTMPSARKSVDEMTDDELRDYAEKLIVTSKESKERNRELTRRAEYVLEKADERKIAIDDEIRGKIKEEPISAESKSSGESQLSKALSELGDIIKRASQKVEKYKPLTKKQDEQWTKAVKTEIEIWKAWTDEKYRKDIMSWYITQMKECAHGKHAAGTMNATLLDDGTRRELTREQVGDTRERTFQQALRVLAMMPTFAAMHSWHLTTAEPAIARRAVRLAPRLSNNA